MTTDRNLVAEFFKTMGHMNEQEKQVVERTARKYSVAGWKSEQIAKAVAAGAASGVIGGPMALVGIGADLAWCGRVGAHGCYGIGHILDKEVDYNNDMDGVLLKWSNVIETTTNVPVGKVGLKLGAHTLGPVTGKVSGKIITKAALKGNSKIAAKLATKAASKAAAKVTAKLAVKGGASIIPILGGVVSGGINWWLVSELMDAAEKFYKNKEGFWLINDPELTTAIINNC